MGLTVKVEPFSCNNSLCCHCKPGGRAHIGQNYFTAAQWPFFDERRSSHENVLAVY